MKLSKLSMQVPNTHTSTKLQGHSPIITPLPLICVYPSYVFTPHNTFESHLLEMQIV